MSAEESSLCLACGLCCGGALFAFVPVEPHEVERLRGRLPIVQGRAKDRVADGVADGEPGSGKARFALPCTGHVGGGCSLYGDRPEVCESYACKQLLRLRRGKTTLAEALAAVGEVRALFTRVDAALPPGGWIWDRARALREAGPPEAIEERRRHAATLLDLKLLEVRIARDLDERAEV